MASQVSGRLTADEAESIRDYLADCARQLAIDDKVQQRADDDSLSVCERSCCLRLWLV
jgi:hypothetical protein